MVTKHDIEIIQNMDISKEAKANILGNNILNLLNM